LQGQAKPEDTVFIYAQAHSGPKMPLAIIRKQVKDLPLTVSLSDADAMMPAMKLSTFKAARLLARISNSGNAMPQPGDLIGTIEQVDIAASETHKITINGRLK
jgi:cytochrome c-type biogenesis protein CcmH